MKESVASSAIILNWFNDVAKCCEANVQAARKVAGTASITVIDLGFLAAPNQNTRIKKGFRPMVSQGSLDSKAPHLLASWHESCSVGFASLLLPARFSKCLLPACQLVLYFEVCGICFYYSLWNLFIEFSSPGMRRIGRHWKEICIWDQSRPAKTNQCRSPRALVPAVAASKGGDQRNLISSTPSTCHNFKGSERKAVSVEFRRNLFIVATARHLLNLLM